MSNNHAKIYVITGPCAAGKTTISGMIASKMNNSAFIQGDYIYLMVVGGFVVPWEDDGTYIDLFWENILAITENFIIRNISVVLEYVIFPEQTKRIVDRFKEKNIPIKYTVLMADENTIRERDSNRDVHERMGERAIILLKELKEMNIEEKYILDTTNLSKDQVVNTIMTENRFLL